MESKGRQELQDSRNYFDLQLNDETARYCTGSLLKLIMENPENTDSKFLKKRNILFSCKDVVVSGSVTNLANYTYNQGVNYKILKYFNPGFDSPILKPLQEELFDQNS